MKSINNPLKLLLAWIFACIVTTLILTLITGVMTSDGEQLPLLIMIKSLDVILVGCLVISLLSPFIYKNWSKKYWYSILVLILLFGALVYNLKL